MDVKTAFLNGYLDETIYMEQPEGYIDQNHKDKVCLLKRSLYGLKQSSRQWNNRFDEFMQKNEYIQSEFDSCIYFRELQCGRNIYLLLYVYDILIACTDEKEVCEFKVLLSTEFEIKDLGDAKKILGMEVVRDRVKGTLTTDQEDYMMRVLDKSGMDQTKSVGTLMGAYFKLRAAMDKEYAEQCEEMSRIPYQSAVGSLMYSMIGTRPDLAFAVGMVCRNMSKPVKEHWNALKWLLRYVRGTTKMKLSYRREGDFVIKGYCDADYAGDQDARRSTT